MSYSLKPHYISLILCFLINFSVNGYSQSALQSDSDRTIQTLYASINRHPLMTIAERIEYISAYFLNKPYELGPLGEGNNAYFDQSPLYRVDKFDCQTYVDTILALALANNLDEFQRCINTIRYKDGKISFISRNHFTSLDWNRNNAKQGYIKDITASVKDEQGESIAAQATALIDKSSWYQHLSLETIKLTSSTKERQKSRLDKLQKIGKQFKKHYVRVAYLPLSTLFNSNKEPKAFLFAQIPNGAIIEIVRPNWDLTKQIGTALNISHLGFVFWKNNQLIFRQASSVSNKIIEIPLVDYLKSALDSPTIKGINVQIVLDKSCN